MIVPLSIILTQVYNINVRTGANRSLPFNSAAVWDLVDRPAVRRVISAQRWYRQLTWQYADSAAAAADLYSAQFSLTRTAAS
jgi:hypothetical protein